MPRKVRELRAQLKREGYVLDTQRGRGSHTWWAHPLVPEAPVNLSGRDGDDAHHYQERDVRNSLRLLHQRQQQRGQP